MEDFIQLKKAANELGEDFIIELTKQLLSMDKKASGELLRSLDYEVIEVLDNLMIRLHANSYILVVDQGRRAGAKPPPSSPIKKWIDIRGIKGRDKKGRFIKSSSLAFIMARSIGKKGIKPTNVINKTINRVVKMKSDILTKAAKEDLLAMVSAMLRKDLRDKK